MIIHLLQAVLLGTIQGIAEFLPISSTAHLIIAEKAIGLNQEVYGLSFDVFTSIGTFIAILVYFKEDIIEILKKIRNPFNFSKLTQDEKIPWLIILATIPAGIAGLLLNDKIETSFRTINVIVFGLIIVGILMIISDKIYKSKENASPSKPILWMGIAQAFALIPGVSRSGSTITTGIFSGLTREKAARYSFLLSIPITAAAILKSVVDFISKTAESGITFEVGSFYLIGMISAGIFGFFSVRYLIDYLKKYSLGVFGYYRIVLGILLLIFQQYL